MLPLLAAFDPHVAGTFPLGIAVAGSDIDVLCHAPDPGAFAAVVWREFAACPGFSMHQWVAGGRAVVACFEWGDVPFELFGSALPVRDQVGWRHFAIERDLLTARGPDFRAAIMAARRAGLKTEPAFARVLGLSGDPYAALLEYAG